MRYPITYGPLEGAVATEVGLATVCFCVEYYESIFPRSLQRTPVIELAEIDGDRAELELMPVLEARIQPTLAPPSRSHHKRVRTHTHTHTHMHMHMHMHMHARAHAHAHAHGPCPYARRLRLDPCARCRG